jgi:hypothetical protein
LLDRGGCQGDRIGRIFAYCAIIYFGQFYNTTILILQYFCKFWATFFHSINYLEIKKNIGCATFRAIFSQTRLVTLVASVRELIAGGVDPDLIKSIRDQGDQMDL